MGELVKGPWGPREEEPEKGNPDSRETKDFCDPRINFRRFTDLMSGASGAYSSLTDRPARERGRREMQEIVKKYTNKELIGWINNSCAGPSSSSVTSGWMQKPTFYLALVDEAFRRELAQRPSHDIG